jgi:hypothetical protein
MKPVRTLVSSAAHLLLIASLGAASAGSLAAQESGRGYLQMGIQEVDLDELNARLAPFGVPTFDEGFFTFGGGGHFEVGRLLLGAEGHALMEQSETTSGFERELSGGTGFFDVGFILIREQNARAYAILGLGAGGMVLQTWERSLPSFDDVMADPRRGSVLTVGGFMAQVSVGADYIARLSPDYAANIGFRAGYLLAPGTDDWRLNGTDLPGGPEVAMEGLFVRFSIGAGGR